TPDREHQRIPAAGRFEDGSIRKHARVMNPNSDSFGGFYMHRGPSWFGGGALGPASLFYAISWPRCPRWRNGAQTLDFRGPGAIFGPASQTSNSFRGPQALKGPGLLAPTVFFCFCSPSR